ncbi:MAG: CPBP family intramembrane glutamic endopeptidase [Ilumatobacteraceae bacterium]
MTPAVDDLDRRTVVLVGGALLCLWGARFGQTWTPDGWTRLADMVWWASTQIVFYLVIPMTVVIALRMRPSDIGWNVRGTSRDWKKYAALFAVAVPFVVVASATSEFQARYPLYDVWEGQTGVWGDLAVWWPFYVAQFVAVETFFRGYLVIGLAPVLGRMSIAVATIPYLMIHFVKPPAEALASIVGGVVMGTLAYRTRSVWWGVALHVAVAALMDVLSLGHKGFVW